MVSYASARRNNAQGAKRRAAASLGELCGKPLLRERGFLVTTPGSVEDEGRDDGAMMAASGG